MKSTQDNLAGYIQNAPASAADNRFLRDRQVWLCYLMMGTYAYLAASMGPIMFFLKGELALSYQEMAWHFSAWSLGSVIAGATGDKIMRRFGKTKTVWTAATLLCFSMIILVFAQSMVVTISSALLSGLSGSVMGQALATIIAERFRENTKIALTEANIAGSMCCCLAPPIIGILVKAGLDWRWTAIIPIAVFLSIYFFAANSLETTSTAGKKRLSQTGKLPGPYWLCWGLIFLSVAAEWSIIYWSSNFLEVVHHITKADAAAYVSIFLLSMVGGRILGRNLVRIYDGLPILRVSALVAIAGFLLFWMSPNLILSLVGLSLSALGIANCYPLTYSAALNCGPGLAQQATARMSLSTGSCTLLAPLVLGSIADKFGMHAAFGVVAALLMTGSLLLLLPQWAKIVPAAKA